MVVDARWGRRGGSDELLKLFGGVNDLVRQESKRKQRAKGGELQNYGRPRWSRLVIGRSITHGQALGADPDIKRPE